MKERQPDFDRLGVLMSGGDCLEREDPRVGAGVEALQRLKDEGLLTEAPVVTTGKSEIERLLGYSLEDNNSTKGV